MQVIWVQTSPNAIDLWTKDYFKIRLWVPLGKYCKFVLNAWIIKTIMVGWSGLDGQQSSKYWLNVASKEI